MKVSNYISAILVGVTTTLQIQSILANECVDVTDNPNKATLHVSVTMTRSEERRGYRYM